MNYLWSGMIVIGILYALFTGNLDAVTEQAIVSAKEAVSLCITMAAALGFWVGMLRIAERSGMIERLTVVFDPVISFLFPSVPKGDQARKPIATNMVANLFGLGWAATPAGLDAMKHLERVDNSVRNETENSKSVKNETGIFKSVENETNWKQMEKSVENETKRCKPVKNETASDAMCDFLIFNISSLQLIPVNIIAYRSQYGSPNPAGIVGAAILATAASTGAAVLFIKGRQWISSLLRRYRSCKKGGLQ